MQAGRCHHGVNQGPAGEVIAKGRTKIPLASHADSPGKTRPIFFLFVKPIDGDMLIETERLGRQTVSWPWCTADIYSALASLALAAESVGG